MFSIMAAPPSQPRHPDAALSLAKTVPASLPPRQGPSPEEWQRYRSTIKRLYVDENKTLKEVMATMAEDFGHRASTKMYKSRITDWKLDKKNKEPEMRAIIRKKNERDAVGKASSFRLRGKLVDINNVLRYFKRKQHHLNSVLISATPEPSTPSDVSCSTPAPSADDIEEVKNLEMEVSGYGYLQSDLFGISGTPDEKIPHYGPHENDEAWNFMVLSHPSPTVPQSILPPLVLLVPERLFTSIDTYFSGSISSGAWATNEKGLLASQKPTSCNPIDFFNLCDTAVGLMQQRSFIEGRLLLSRACAMTKAIVIEECPLALEYLLASLLIMTASEFGELATMTRSYIGQIAEYILPSNHPWRQICKLLGQVQVDDVDLQTLLLRAWACIADTYERELEPFHKRTLQCRSNLLTLYPKRENSDAEAQMRRLLSDCERVCGRSDVRSLVILLQLGWNLHDQDRCPEAEGAAEDLLQRALGAGILASEFEGLQLLAHSYYLAHKLDLAEKTLRQAIDRAEKLWGRIDTIVIYAMINLEQWLRGWGREDEADQIKAEYMESVGSDDLDMV